MSRYFHPSPARIRGHDLGKPRLTAAGWVLILLYFGVPAMLVGALVDVLIQWTTGECVGLWCWFLR
jgi:hypothetical protein